MGLRVSKCQRRFYYFDSKMSILSFKIAVLMLIVDIWAIGSILENGGESPNSLCKLIGIIKLGKMLIFGIELEIMKLTHYMVE